MVQTIATNAIKNRPLPPQVRKSGYAPKLTAIKYCATVRKMSKKTEWTTGDKLIRYGTDRTGGKYIF